MPNLPLYNQEDKMMLVTVKEKYFKIFVLVINQDL